MKQGKRILFALIAVLMLVATMTPAGEYTITENFKDTDTQVMSLGPVDIDGGKDNMIHGVNPTVSPKFTSSSKTPPTTSLRQRHPPPTVSLREKFTLSIDALKPTKRLRYFAGVP